ncbi:MAG: hypothetical protein J6S57_00820 [Alphaproteobacteria bacterium]|nr:hypothetical protein [Alphaproteobacteria bacterium]
MNTYDNFNNALSLERYRFENAKLCNDYYKLLDGLSDYTLFLAQEYNENGELFNFLQSTIDAFNIKYGGNFQEETRKTQRQANRILRRIGTYEITTDAFEGYHPLVIKSRRFQRFNQNT